MEKLRLRVIKLLSRRPDIGQTTKADCGPKTCDYDNSYWPHIACTLVCYRTIKQTAQRIQDQEYKWGNECSPQWLTSSLQSSGGQDSSPVVRNLLSVKRPIAMLQPSMTLWWEWSCVSSRGYTLQQSVLCCTMMPCWGLLFLLLGHWASQVLQLVSGRATLALLAESKVHFLMHTCVVCYYCPKKWDIMW